MKYQSIAVGQSLRLKPARQAAYGLASPFVLVSALKSRPGYKVPWVQSGELFFAPSDFAGLSS